MRLDKRLCLEAGLTRSQARRLVYAGRVTVDGAPVRDAGQPVTEGTEIALDGVRLAHPDGPCFLMLNKPRGFVCSTSDPDHPTVLDLLPPTWRARNPHPAGRLDLDATGLVLLTSDGDWSHRVTSPSTGCPKTYRVTLAEPLAGGAGAALEAGMMLRGERRSTRPAKIRVLSPTEVSITVTEGRYHLVKRLFAAIGNRVVHLHRERIGKIGLDPGLGPGECRPLTRGEIEGVTSR